MNYKQIQKDKNTKCLYLREVRRQRWYCKVTPSEERRSKSLVISIRMGEKIIKILYLFTCTRYAKKKNQNNFKKVHNLEPAPLIQLCLTSYSPFFWETLKNREGPPLLWGPRIFDLIHFAHGRFCPYLPTMVGQRTLWTGGRFCPLTARGLKIAPQGENSAGRPHPDRWTQGQKYR